MKTDMLILQVADKVRKDHKLQYRNVEKHPKSKNFLERYTAYAITNVRKAMMQNLKRNAPLVMTTNGKRMKKKLITYNPDVHVKNETDSNDSSMLSIEITNNDMEMQETSTITMDKSGDDVKASIMEAFIQYFNNGGVSLNNSQDFLLVWGKHIEQNGVIKPGNPMNISGMPSLNNDLTLMQPGIGGPMLSLGANVTDMQSDSDFFHGTGNTDLSVCLDNIQNSNVGNERCDAGNNQSHSEVIDGSGTSVVTGDVDKDAESTGISELDEYEGETNCENCDLTFYNCSTHNHDSLLNEFGPGMKCVGDNCGKTLYHCLNEVHKDVRGAFICDNCRDKKCRQMKCNVCYFVSNDTGRGRRTRKSSA